MSHSSDSKNFNKSDLDGSKPGSTSNSQYVSADGTREKNDGIATSSTDEIQPEYATGVRLAFIMFTVLVSTIIVGLQLSIVATVIPDITNEFRRLDHVGWYGCATFIPSSSAAPLWGKLYKYFYVKWTFLIAIMIFLVGVVVIATAPNSVSLIIGRVLQGCGSSGVMSGTLIVINYVTPPRSHPLMIGTWITVLVVSTIVGPVIGGGLASEVSWRWCFWIVLPIGGPVIVLILLFLRIPKHIKPVPATWIEIILNLDIPGFCLILVSLICFTLALQWGGQTKAWNHSSVIATMVLWSVFTVCFFVTEWLQGPRAMAPFSILKQRTTWSNVIFCLISYAALYHVTFYLPIYFQSVHGQSALTSGVNFLPTVVFFALGSIVTGAVIGKTRYTQPYELLGALIMTAGIALIYILDVDSSKALYIGAQVPFGFGVGIISQIPIMTVQGFSKPEDIASASGIMVMCQSLSGAYFVVSAQSVFANRMLQTFLTRASNIDPAVVLGTGASELQDVFSGDVLIAVIAAYMEGIKGVFAFALACAALSVLLTLIIPFKKLPDHGKKPATEAKKAKVVAGEKNVAV